MGIAALVLGLSISLVVIGSSASANPVLIGWPDANPGFDVGRFFLGVVPIVGSLLAPWRKGAAVTLS